MEKCAYIQGIFVTFILNGLLFTMDNGYIEHSVSVVEPTLCTIHVNPVTVKGPKGFVSKHIMIGFYLATKCETWKQ